MNSHEPPCLIIPDVHQDTAWVDAILRSEADSVDRVVFLGDYFDPKSEAAASPAETARYFSALADSYPCEFTFLVGNHDLPYLFDFLHGTPASSFFANPYPTNSYNPLASREIAAELSSDFVASLEPFALRHRWLLSHAGLHRDFLRHATLETLFQVLKQQLNELPADPYPTLAAVGRARGGYERAGGITWQDWHHEFEDSLAWPQIVGHTVLVEPERKGRSWNIDARQSRYALLSADGLEIRTPKP